ncbi:hypothetical protein QP278_22940 [Escherichia coli]|nr:hypothetical protein [Escherichia coli]
MTERQQNRNICVVGKVKDGLTIDTSKIEIVDATLLLRASMRNAPTRIYLPSVLKGAHPAFEAWADKRSIGEKLPRGRYFKSREFIRQFKIKIQNHA